jgi:hypothetical protein
MLAYSSHMKDTKHEKIYLLGMNSPFKNPITITIGLLNYTEKNKFVS